MILLIWVHFLADFPAQTDAMALHKSSSNGWLGLHVLVYTIFMLFFGLKFALINGVLHFCCGLVHLPGDHLPVEAGEAPLVLQPDWF